jgi:Amt family ammonium transporter
MGVRRGYPKTAMHPNNLVLTLLGAGLLWVGWFGFNAGSSVNSGLDTARALTVTQAAAAAGALAWILIEAFKHKKATSLGLASGILAGLVVITPAAGVVGVKGALTLGFLASFICYSAIQIKTKLGYDDSLDVFGIHGCAGIAGAIGLTFFINADWMSDAAASAGGAWTTTQQLIVQVKAVGITIIYCAVVTLILAFIIDKIFGLRLNKQAELIGLDQSIHGEHGYGLVDLS